MTAKILCVEDDVNNRLLIRRILMAEGYQVIEAANAVETIRQVQDQHPDLVLMDINLPVEDGYILTAKLRMIPHMTTVPIIAVTANVMRGDRERSLEAGCDGYIQKPIDVDLLPQQIQQFLKR